MDIFPVQAERPIRIELWGDEIDSMTEFDTDTQRRNGEKLLEIEIPPASEILYDCNELADAIEALSKKVRGKHINAVRDNLSADVRRLRAGEILVHGIKYYPLVYPETATVFDYIDSTVSFIDYSEVMAAAEGIQARYTEDIRILIEDGQLCRGLEGYCMELSAVRHLADSRKCLYISSFLQSGDRVDFRRLVSFEASQTASWSGELKQLTEDLSEYISRKFRVILVAGREKKTGER